MARCMMLISRSRNLARLLLISASLSFSACLCAEEKNMNTESLWLLASELRNSIGMNASVIGEITGQPLSRVDPDNDIRLTTPSFKLDDGVQINNFIVRLHVNYPHSINIINFDIEQSCILVSQVKDLYPQLTLSGVPRGRATNEKFNWVTPKDDKGNRIILGFSQSTPSCLKSLGFRHYDN